MPAAYSALAHSPYRGAALLSTPAAVVVLALPSLHPQSDGNYTLLVTVLVVLSTVKFMFVIFYFMHLRWDKAFCTILFFIGLVLAGGTMWALLKLFGAEASKPLSMTRLDPPAIVLQVVV